MLNRRKFLKTSAAISLASSFPNFLFQSKKKSLGVALVGLGYYSRDLLAPALQMTKQCHLAGIVTGTPSKIPIWQSKYGIKDSNVYNYENMAEIANNNEIDVIYIVLPTGLHAEYAIKAANTGKHVWCEKPMARTVAECQDIINACNSNKVKLSIGYRMQHETNTQKIIEYAKNKNYGQILEVKAEAGYNGGRINPWKLKKSMGGGAIYDMGVYPINASRYATQEDPLRVLNAKHENKRPEIFTEVNETTFFTLEFPSGAIANGKTSFGESMNELSVDCSNGWYELKPFQSYSGVRGKTSDGIILKPMRKNQQALQMDDDALAILNDTDVLVPGIDGLKDIAIVEAVLNSAKTGQSVDLKF